MVRGLFRVFLQFDLLHWSESRTAVFSVAFGARLWVGCACSGSVCKSNGKSYFSPVLGPYRDQHNRMPLLCVCQQLFLQSSRGQPASSSQKPFSFLPCASDPANPDAIQLAFCLLNTNDVYCLVTFEVVLDKDRSHSPHFPASQSMTNVFVRAYIPLTCAVFIFCAKRGSLLMLISVNLLHLHKLLIAISISIKQDRKCTACFINRDHQPVAVHTSPREQ